MDLPALVEVVHPHGVADLCAGDFAESKESWGERKEALGEKRG
jgi:hypothetical protein